MCIRDSPEGIAALPRAMAAQLRTSLLHLGEGAIAVAPTKVRTSEREYQGRVVIVATDTTDANALIPGAVSYTHLDVYKRQVRQRG